MQLHRKVNNHRWEKKKQQTPSFSLRYISICGDANKGGSHFDLIVIIWSERAYVTQKLTKDVFFFLNCEWPLTQETIIFHVVNLLTESTSQYSTIMDFFLAQHIVLEHDFS